MTRTCEKCQSIPRYRLKQDGPPNKVLLACWAHMPRCLDELIGPVTTVNVSAMKQ